MTRKKVDREGPIHRGILAWLRLVLPARAMVHHSPNEVDLRGGNVASAIAKARALGTMKGWPDLEIVLDGRVYFLEVKAPRGAMSAGQRAFQCRCNEMFQPYAVVRSIDDARAALAAWGVEMRGK